MVPQVSRYLKHFEQCIKPKIFAKEKMEDFIMKDKGFTLDKAKQIGE